MKCHLPLASVQWWLCQAVMLYFCKSTLSSLNDIISRVSYTHSYMGHLLCSWMKDSPFISHYGNTSFPTASPCCHNCFGECLYQPLETQRWKRIPGLSLGLLTERALMCSVVSPTHKKSQTFLPIPLEREWRTLQGNWAQTPEIQIQKVYRWHGNATLVSARRGTVTESKDVQTINLV